MALSARELFLIVRAQNQASSVLRRVSADMSALGRKEQLAQRRASLGLQQQRLLSQGQAIRSKLAQEETGSNALRRQMQAQQLMQKRVKLEDSINASSTARSRNVRTLYEAETRQLRLENRRKGLLSEIGRVNQQIGKYKGIIAKSDDPDMIRTLNREITKLSGSSKSMGRQLSFTNRDIKGNLMNMDNLRSGYGDITARQNQYRASLQATASEQAIMNKRSAEAAERTARLRNNLTANVQALAQNQQKFKQLAQDEKAFKMERLQQGVHLIGSMGRQLQLVGFAGAAALGFAANSAAQLSTSVTLATTQYVNNVRGIKNASDVNFSFILKQMREFPSAAEDMSASLYDIFSTLNVNGPQGRQILEQVNKAAVAGQLSTQEATAGLLSVMSNFKEVAQNGKGAADALNRSFAAVRFGRVTMSQFSTSLQTTAPAANQAGQSFDDLAGSVAYLSRSLGISKASVGYARLLQQLFSTKMTEGLKKHGIAVRDAAGNYRSLDAVMANINQKFPQLAKGQQSAQNFFKDLSGATGTVQASRAFTAIITNMHGYNSILNKTKGDNNEFKKSFDALNQTAGVQFAKALNVLKSLWVDLGRSAIPTIAALLAPIGELADKLSHMDQATKDNIGRVVALTVAIAGVTGVILSFASAIGGALLILGTLEGPVLLGMIGGFIALGAAIYLVIDNWDKVKPRLIAWWPTVSASVKDAVKTIDAILGDLANIMAALIGIADALIRGDWGDLWRSASEVVKNFADILKQALKVAENIVKGFFTMFTSSVQGWAAATGIAVVTVVKLTSALREMAAAYALVAAGQTASDVAGGGGFLTGMGANLGRLIGGIKTFSRNVVVAKSYSGSWAKALASVAGEGIPALAGLSVGATAAAATVGVAGLAGAFLILQHYFPGSQMNEFIDQQKKLMDSAHNVTSAIHSEADALDRLGNSAQKFTGAQLDLAQAKLDVRTTRRSLAQARADAKADGKISADERNTIDQAVISYKRAQAALGPVTGAYVKAKDAFRTYRQKAAGALASTPIAQSQKMNDLLERRAKLTRDMAAIEASGVLLTQSDPRKVEQYKRMIPALKDVNDEIGKMAKGGETISQTPDKIARYIKAIIPDASKIDIRALFSRMQTLGRIMMPREMKLYLTTVGGEKAKKEIKDVQDRGAQLSKHKIKQIIEVTTQQKGGRSPSQAAQQAANSYKNTFERHGRDPVVGLNAQPAMQAAQKLTANLDKIGHKVVKPQVKTQFKPDLATIGGTAQELGTVAKTGVLTGASGLGDQLGAQLTRDVLLAIQHGKDAAQAKSPSKLTAKEIGKPLAQGIIQGFSDEMRKNWEHTAKSVQQMILKGVSLTGSAKEKAKAIADAFNQAMDTAIQTLKDKWNEIHDLNQQNFGELFQGPDIQQRIDWGEALNIGDLQKDLNNQLSTFRKFNRSLTLLHRRGGPQSLIDQLRQLGPSAQNEIDALNKATKPELRKYERTWNQSQKAINKATKQQFKTQIKEWRKQGKSIAAGILLGLKDGQRGLERYFRQIWLNMIRSAQKTNKSHSPSKVYAREGRNIIEGLQLGMQRASRGMTVPMPALPPVGGGGRLGRAVEHHDHTHYHIPGNPMPNLMTQLRREDYHRRRRE